MNQNKPNIQQESLIKIFVPNNLNQQFNFNNQNKNEIGNDRSIIGNKYHELNTNFSNF